MKADVVICDNCKAVTLLWQHIKFWQIFYMKVVTYAEEVTGGYQGGFRKGRSTLDQIFYYDTNIGNVLGT
jgi:hypothetical protein